MSQKLVTKVFRYALNAGTDRLTIKTASRGLTVDFRHPSGETSSISVPPRLQAEFLTVLRRLLSLAPGELSANRYGKLHQDGCRLDFRLTVRPEDEGDMIILNVANRPFQVWRLNQLGLSLSQLAAARRFLSSRSGLLIVSSSSQQGRTSTLSALLLEAVAQPRSVYWLCGREGLPEYEIPGASYLSKNNLSRDRLLRHDAEIIFIDDADDAESLAFAWQAATTGRLVVIARQGDNAAEIAANAQETAKNLNLPGNPLRLVLAGHLKEWPRRSPRSRRTRENIGRFQIWQS